MSLISWPYGTPRRAIRGAIVIGISFSGPPRFLEHFMAGSSGYRVFLGHFIQGAADTVFLWCIVWQGAADT
eukprot:4353479-Karenia_brevis.AAC.1